MSLKDFILAEYSREITIEPAWTKTVENVRINAFTEDRPLRKDLKKFYGQRLRFQAKVDKFGLKSSFRGMPKETILLTDVRIIDSNELVTDHLWFTKGKSWNPCQPNDVVHFDARVGMYEKGYKGYRDDVFCEITIDYRLERPTKVVVVDC